MKLFNLTKKGIVLLCIPLFIFSVGGKNDLEKMGSNSIKLRKDTNINPLNSVILDTIIVKKIIIDTESKKEITVKYHLIVYDWLKPVDWTLDFYFGNKSVYHEKSNDGYIDTLFFNIGNPNREPANLSWKKDWYLNGILDFRSEEISIDDKRRKAFKNTSMNMAVNNYKAYGNTKDEAISNWESLWSYFEHKKIIAFYFLLAPEGKSTPLMVFHPIVKRLFPVYSP